MLLKDISYLELWQPYCSAEQNHLYNFSRGHNEEKFCEFISNLGQLFRRCRLKDFLSGVLAAPCSMEQNLKCKFERGNNEHSCADISKYQKCDAADDDDDAPDDDARVIIPMSSLLLRQHKRHLKHLTQFSLLYGLSPSIFDPKVSLNLYHRRHRYMPSISSSS